MNKCVYCDKEIELTDVKFLSLIHPDSYVCEECVWHEDSIWFASKNILNYPDFSKELSHHFKLFDNEK